MSGFEVVGVVLGALPLLISGLKHYADGLQTLKTMWNYEAVVNHLVTDFMLSQSIFMHSCQNLLGPILPDAEAANLLEGVSPKWEDPSLDKQLREYLGPDYEVYTRAVRHLKRRIDLFTKKLGLDTKTMLPPWMSNAKVDKKLRDKFFRHSWQRIRGGFDTSAIEHLLSEIQGNIKQIADFTRGSAAVAPKRVAIRELTRSRYWLRTRDCAKRLFECLYAQWSCACPRQHCASLRLDSSPKFKSHEEKETSFNVLFSYDINLAARPTSRLPWNWREVDIQQKPVREQLSLESRSRQSAARHVSFNVSSRSDPSTPGSSNAAPPLYSAPRSQIKDLCYALSQSPQPSSCIGYFEHDEFQHHVFTSAHGINADEVFKIVCFHDFLRYPNMHNLGVKDKYKLALTLASAVLQLHATPWLKERWCLEDIHLIHGPQNSPLNAKAYLTTRLTPSGCLQNSTNSMAQPSAQTRACILVANETIFALGVALIELSFGVPILSLKETTDPILPDLPGFTEFYIATRLVNGNAIKARDHDKYADVVLRCVRGQLSTLTTPLSLENAKVQQSFYEDIVLPLQDLNRVLNEDDRVDMGDV